MYESYIVPAAIVIFLVSFVLGLNVGMMLMQSRMPRPNSTLYERKTASNSRELRKRDFVLDFGLP